MNIWDRLNVWIKGGIIVILLILLIVILNYEPPVEVRPKAMGPTVYEPMDVSDEEIAQRAGASGGMEVPPEVIEQMKAKKQAPVAAAPVKPVAPAVTQGQSVRAVPGALPVKPAEIPKATIQGKYYTVQIAAYRDQGNAQAELKELTSAGHAAEIITSKTSKGDTLHNVVVGRFGSKAEAQVKVEELKSKYKDAYIRTQNH